MKYEIIKGSEKDFEFCDCDVLTKYRIIGHDVVTHSTHSSKKLTTCSLGHVVDIIAERRPITEPALEIEYVKYNGIDSINQPITEPELKPIYGDGIHDDSEALQQRIDMGIDINNIIGKQWKLFNISRSLQFKPISEPVWDGKGLPPVGVECEILWGDDWVKCVVKYFGEEQLIFKAKGNREWAGHINNYKFRPIRSPEDVARSNIIGEMERAYEELTGKPAREAEEYYDFIAAGKIPGVEITK